MIEIPDSLKNMLKTRMSGAGTHFNVTSSNNLNIALYSTEEIKASLEGRGEIIRLHIKSSKEGVNTSQITIVGLKANTTYHLYQDQLYNHTEFTTDGNGGYSFVQDIAAPHLVLINAQPSTVYLYETGFNPASAGTWDPVSRIATLAQDITSTLVIAVDNATLTGLKPDNTMYVISSSASDGVFISNYHDITIENIEIKDCNGTGIYIDNSTNISIQNSSIHDNDVDGIGIDNSTNILIQNNSIYGSKNFDGIYLQDNNSSITIQNNSIYGNNLSGIDIYSHNINNVIQGNSIYGNNFTGIVLVEFNTSNSIQNNVIYDNGQSGIYFSIDQNNSNNILCNRISNNGITIPFYGAFITGSDNLVRHNSFINNKQFNAYNFGATNTYSGNFWSDWNGIIPYSFAVSGFDYSPFRFPVSCMFFKQLSVQEYVTIPEQKPCAEEILKCNVDVEIAHVKVINTPMGISLEGQVLKGYEAIIEGNLVQKIEYIADEPEQSVHAAHFITPFSAEIMLEEDYVLGTPLHINSTIEDVYYTLLDKRRIFKNVTLYLEAKEM